MKVEISCADCKWINEHHYSEHCALGHTLQMLPVEEKCEPKHKFHEWNVPAYKGSYWCACGASVSVGDTTIIPPPEKCEHGIHGKGCALCFTDDGIPQSPIIEELEYSRATDYVSLDLYLAWNLGEQRAKLNEVIQRLNSIR